MNTHTRTIIITSNEPWGDVWFSKHYYAIELAKLGHKVYFLNSPESWEILNFFSLSIRKIPISENLVVVNYQNNFPLRIFKRFFLKINDFINSLKIANIVMERGEIIWWQFDPFRFVDIWFFRNAKRIFHITDPYFEILTNISIAKNADLIVLLLDRYFFQYSSINKNVIIIPHGINKEEFLVNKILIEKLKNEFPDSILFIGSIDDQYNIGLLDKISDGFPTFTLLLIGPEKLKMKNNITVFQKMLQKPNVRWLGQQKTFELKNFISSSLVCIVPYLFNIENQKGSSIKVIHYLAHQKIVVTSIKTGYEHLINEGIYFAENEKEFLNLISNALQNKLVFNKDKINEYLKSINYPNLIDRILKQVNNSK